MKNKKGFTLVEVLAVIVLLGILASVATVGVSKYRKDVDEKEMYSIKQTIKAAFTNYRILNDVSPKVHRGLNAEDEETEIMKLLKFDGGNVLKYGGEKCEIGDDSKVLYLINGDYYNDSKFSDAEKVKYKICELDGSGKGCSGECEGNVDDLNTEDLCGAGSGQWVTDCSGATYDTEEKCNLGKGSWLPGCIGATYDTEEKCNLGKGEWVSFCSNELYDNQEDCVTNGGTWSSKCNNGSYEEDLCSSNGGTWSYKCFGALYSTKSDCTNNGGTWSYKCIGVNFRNQKVCDALYAKTGNSNFEWKTVANKSYMETICIRLSCNGNVIIDDFNDESSLCKKVKGDLGIS